MFCAVILENKRKLVVPEEWIRIVDRDLFSIYYSPDENSAPDFDKMYYQFHAKEARSYYGYILQKFGEFCCNLVENSFEK